MAPTTTLMLGSSLSLAGDRYMQTYFGINEAQSLRTGYPVYTPKAGLRDLSGFANVRHDIGEDWIVLSGTSGASGVQAAPCRANQCRASSVSRAMPACSAGSPSYFSSSCSLCSSSTRSSRP